ncbi:Ras family [Plasmodiophora brassicae]|nr:hypothetical protein PBRA_003608 [Plasmodiophora brassicae]
MLKTRVSKTGARQVQVIVVGSFGSGKSSFVSKLLNEDFSPKHVATLGAEMFIKETQYQEEFISLNIWSCGGHERFRPVVQHLYDDTQVAVIVYDRTSEASFREVAYWRNEMQRCFPSSIGVVVGLKSDMDEAIKVNVQDAEHQTEMWNLPHWIASCKTGENVNEILQQLLQRVGTKL